MSLTLGELRPACRYSKKKVRIFEIMDCRNLIRTHDAMHGHPNPILPTYGVAAHLRSMRTDNPKQRRIQQFTGKLTDPLLKKQDKHFILIHISFHAKRSAKMCTIFL